MRVVVTGSEGFIGSRLAFPGDRWLGIDSLLDLDVLDPRTAQIVADFDPHVVFHLAAHHFVPWCEANPDETTRLNVQGTGMMLAACGESLQAVVLASSAAVYGFHQQPVTELDGLGGTDVYARSKQRAEAVLVRFSEMHPHARCVAARLFNVVGAGDKQPHILPEIVRRMNETVLLGATWPKRDYIHVEDVADALRFLAANAPAGFSAWNVGTGVATSVRDLVSLVSMRAKRDISTETYAGKMRATDGHLVANPSALKMLGWQAKRTLAEAVDETLAYA